MKKILPLVVGALLLASCYNEEITHEVRWLNYDGTVLEIDTKVPHLSMPEYNGITPTKPDEGLTEFVFSGWDKELTKVVEDVTYTATFGTVTKNEVLPNYESGFYDEPISLSLVAPEGYEIYYSLDNTDPDENSIKYTGSITINDVSNNANNYCLKTGIAPYEVYYPTELVDKSVIIKAIGINKTTKKTTPIKYMTYFIGYKDKSGYNNMPVVTLTVNDDDLFDYEKGIYVTGKIYDESEHTGYPETYPANYNQKGKNWERPANFKYFDANKALILEQNIGIRIHGGWSRAFNQKSFNLYARKDYDAHSTFNYKFFNDINAQSLMLRSGGYRDTTVTKVRDSLIHDMSTSEAFDVQRSFPTIVFLNGEYWGIYNLQERFTDKYVEEHHGINKKNVLIIENDEVDEGNETDYHYYQELIDFFADTDLSSNENYLAAQNYIDMEEFASYMSTQLYVGNIDWPANNVRLFKDVSDPNSKWHFMMYDTDDSSNMVSHMCAANIDPFLKSSHWKSGPLESDCLLGLMLSKLLENETFKTLFIQTFTRIGEQNFRPQKIKGYLDAKKALLSTPMVKNYKRFVDNGLGVTYYQNQIDVIQQFFDTRYNYAIGFLNSHI